MVNAQNIVNLACLRGIGGADEHKIAAVDPWNGSMAMGDADFLWSGPVPVRFAPAALTAIADWCRARRIVRPALIGGGSLTAAPLGLGLVHGLEARGFAVWTFDRATNPTIAAVADAVAGYHFEFCDAVIAIGGAAAMDVAKAVALMAGQRNPYRLLAPDPGADGEPVDASGIPPVLAVPTTPAAALAANAVIWIADEAGVARPLRHPALRPSEAILAGDLVDRLPPAVHRRSAAVAALTAVDAGAATTAAARVADPGQDLDAVMRAALEVAAPVEAARGPRRRLALTAAIAGGADFAATMLGLAEPADWLSDLRDLLGVDGVLPAPALVRAAREACEPHDAAAVDAVLISVGIDPLSVAGRRGRRGRRA